MSEEGHAPEGMGDMDGAAPEGSAPPPADLASQPPPMGDASPPPMGDASPPPMGSQPPMASTPPPEEQWSEPPPDMPPPSEDIQVEASAPSPQPGSAKPKKRKKIDLKSRLSTVRASGSMALGSSPSTADRKSDPLAFPPPPTSGGVPAPRLPGALGPMVSSPFAPPEPEKKVTAQAQTIKVEMGEEVQQERAKTKKRSAVYVAIAAIAAGAIGFILGGVREKATAGNLAVEGAKGLAADIEAANTQMSDLSDALRNAGDKLSTEEFPDELAEILKSTNVDFDTSKFKSRVRGLPAAPFANLLAYTQGVDDLNKKKDALRNLLGRAKKPVVDFIAEKKKPKMKYAITFGKSQKQLVAEFVSIKDPFEVKGDWPAKITIVKGKGKKAKEEELKRFDGKGKVGQDKLALPIEHKSASQFTDLTLIYALRKALGDTRSMIDGVESNIPAQQKDGLLKDGKQLVEELNKIALKGT